MVRYRTIAAGVVLFLAATAVHAGPISWTYSATLTGDRGSAYVYDGYGARIDATEPGGFRYYAGYAHLGVAANSGAMAGTQQFHLGFANSSAFFWNTDLGTAPVSPFDDAPVPGGRVDSSFQATLTIRDGASGDSKTFSVGGTAMSSDSYLGLPVSLWLSGQNASPGILVDQIIGQNDYRIRFDTENLSDRTGPDSVESWLSVDVQVSPVATPEPATLVLATIGLIGVVGIRRLRSRSGPPALAQSRRRGMT
jgi:hypothetical protein